MRLAAPLTAEHRASAPALAAALAALLVRLSALVLHRLLRHPRYAANLIPLTNYITRTGRRFARLMARAAAGTERPRSRPATSLASAPRTRKPATKPHLRLPLEKAWLLHTLKHEAAFFTGRINDIFAEPGATALLAAIPQAASLLRPIARMLGVDNPALAPLPRRRRKPKPAPPPAATPPICMQRQGRGPTPALAPEAPPGHPPPLLLPCPRLATRWPFNLHPNIRIA